MATPRRIAIIGGGASGALLALALLRENRGRPLHLAIVEPRPRLARGIAYSTEDPLHLLNVPARSMSALEGDPDDLLRWARADGAAVEPDDFIPRRDFGRYLEERLAAAVAAAPAPVSVEHVGARVERLEATGAVLDSGARVAAEDYVLAVGGGPPRLPAPRGKGIEPERFVADPWAVDPRRIAAPGESVLLVGTGLTMVDVALSLSATGEQPRMLAISRAGLAPLGHRPGRPLEHPPFPLPADGRVDLGRLLQTFFAELSRVGAEGGDACDVIDAMRPVTQRIWSGLDADERRWFLEHLRRQWEVRRHRMAPAVSERVERLRASGRLRIEAAALTRLDPDRDGVRAELRRGGRREWARFDRVVNCAGAEDDVRRFPEPLPSLLVTGRLRPDPLRLGLDVDSGGTALAGDSRATTVGGSPIHVIGPLRKGALWESTAIPEIRRQATDLADLILRRRPAVAVAAEAA
jgi:uncharacterized NAD(P)/FAD-binding protein YdhS